MEKLLREDWVIRNIGVEDFKKIVDKCRCSTIDAIPDITFDKIIPYNYHDNCDTLYGSLTGPSECHWRDCHLHINRVRTRCSDDYDNTC